MEWEVHYNTGHSVVAWEEIHKRGENSIFLYHIREELRNCINEGKTYRLCVNTDLERKMKHYTPPPHSSRSIENQNIIITNELHTALEIIEDIKKTIEDTIKKEL